MKDGATAGTLLAVVLTYVAILEVTQRWLHRHDALAGVALSKVCACGHTAYLHSRQYGYCTQCLCVMFRIEYHEERDRASGLQLGHGSSQGDRDHGQAGSQPGHRGHPGEYDDRGPGAGRGRRGRHRPGRVPVPGASSLDPGGSGTVGG